MKVGPKLIGGFLVVAALALVVGLVGYLGMKSITASTYQITEKTVPQLTTLDEVDGSIRDVRRIQAGMVLAKIAKNEVLFAQYEADVKKARDEQLAGARVAFDKIPRSEAADKSWLAVGRSVDDYLASALQVSELLATNKVEEGQALFLGDSREKFAKVNSSVTELTDVVTKTAAAREADVRKTESTATAILFAVVFSAIALAILLGIFISRSLTAPLAEVAARAERLQAVCITGLEAGLSAMARGDLSVTCEASTKKLNYERADEIGNVAETVDNIIGKAQAAIGSYGKLQQIVKALIDETAKLSTAAHEGALSTRGDLSKFTGSYHDLVKGFNTTLDLVIDPVNEAAAVLQRVAERDLTARVTTEYRGDHAKIKDALNSAVDNLSTALSEVNSATEQVASAADQIATSAQSLARGASEEASTIEEVSSSLHEITSMARTSAASAKEAETLALAAKSSTEEGGERMNALADAMQKLKSSSDQTAKIVKTIDEIAFQTNLLALNAAVEAARAGDAGRGFAVVAEEVRALAIRAASAAKQTAELIEESVGHTQQGVTMTAQVQETFNDIFKRASRVGEVMAEMSAASEQQTIGIGQVNTAVEQMNNVTQQTAATAEESASAAEELTSQATQMKGLVAQFILDGGNRAAFRAPPSVRRVAAPQSASKRFGSNGKTNGNGNGRVLAGKTSAQLIPFGDDETALAEF